MAKHVHSVTLTDGDLDFLRELVELVQDILDDVEAQDEEE